MLIFIFFLIMKVSGAFHISGPKEVRISVGGTVQIACPYHSFYQDNVKYWCRGYYWNYCSVLQRSRPTPPQDGDLLVSDNKQIHMFTVTMRRVQEQDSGRYWCAIQRVSKHVKVPIELIIMPEMKTERVTMTSPSLITTPELLSTTVTSTPPSTVTPMSPTSGHVTVDGSTEWTEDVQELVWTVWSISHWVLFAALALTPVAVKLCFVRRTNINNYAGHKLHDQGTLGMQVMDPTWIALRTFPEVQPTHNYHKTLPVPKS
ncbi:CMRF35-like molecule 5 [Brienomyrus brachyistius]|uniref:CMRF35-like molecule 5 n=1 Tax=Brienomyrus brachyistius TaxID=42636 RepID=UPI0020B3F5F4|nr:CMRF35-like molecule 5 [Brienomyrus brachyistius]